MSEILAEARVLVLPDTSAFRATLLGELNAIQASVKPIVVPVASTGAAAVTKANEEVVASSTAATVALEAEASAVRQQGAASVNATAQAAAFAKAQQLRADATARLVGAEGVASLRATELARARALLGETSAAVGIAEKALAAAVASGDSGIRTSTEALLEHARAEEIAAEATVRGVIAQEEQAAAATAAAATQRKAAASLVSTQGAANRAATLGIAAETQLGNAATVAALKTSELAKARAILSETSGAVAIAQRALASALEAGNVALIDATSQTLKLTLAQEGEAESAVAATIAQNKLVAAEAEHAAKQAFAARGAGTGALALLGLRGATLAANASFIAGAAAFIAFSKAVSSAAGLEQELNVFRVTAKATNEDLQRVSETAKQLGADVSLPAVSATDAAQAMTELAKAGLSVQDSIAGARGVLQLSTAAEIDNAAATNIAANALNSFGLGGDQAVHVADLLANASIEAQGSISDMGAALTAVSAVAKLVGVSLDDTVALITLLAKNGLAGARGGTALKVAFLRLVAPSTAAAKVIKDLGIQIRDAQGNIRPDVFAQFTEATSKLAPAVAQADAAIVFGTRGIQAASIAGREGAEGLNAMQVAVERQGAAADIAGARTTGFSGKIEALKSTMETLGTTLGKFTLGPLGNAADGLTTIAGDAEFAAQKMQEFNDSLPGGGGGGSTFFGRVLNNLTSGFGDTQREISATIELLKRGEAIKFGQGPISTLRDLNRQLETAQESIPSVRDRITELFQAFQQGGGRTSSTALNEFVVGLQRLVKAEEEGLVTNDQLATRIRGLINQLQDPNAFKIDIGVNLDEAGLKNTASRGANAVLGELQSTLSPEVAKAIGLDFMTNIGVGAVDAASDAGDKAGQAFALSLDDALAVAEATGQSDSVTIAGLRKRAATEQATVDRLSAIPKSERTRQQQNRLAKASRAVNATNAAIQNILDKQATAETDAANKAKTTADNIAKARNEADQRVLDGFTAVLAKPKRLLTRAAGTKPLGDDIKFAKQILGIINTQIKNAAKDIKDAKTRRETLDRLLTDRLNIQKTISDLVKNRQEAIRKAAEDRRTRLREGLQLDIDFAATKGNVQGEIRAHLRLLVQLQKDLIRVRKQYGKNSNEAKEVRNAIAVEQKAIDDLRGQTKQRNDAFRKLTFEFLQTQQGFAANLLGNLIPSGALGGLVGRTTASGTSPTDKRFSPEAGVTTQAAVNKGEAWARGDVKSQIDILRQILSVLETGHRQAKHPEAKQQRRNSAALMDYEHGRG